MPIDRHAPNAEAQLDDLLKQLTLDEKIRLIHGDGVFTVAGVPRLGIEDLHLSDGPHGVRQECRYAEFVPLGDYDDATTYLPVGIALAATWNVERAYEFGDVLGAESRARNKDIILGPGVNLIRTPLCGRNFEYFSEDPHHAARMAVPLIQAVQLHDVAADVKHFACNNQELNRSGVDVHVDERALRELYLPAFEAAVTEGACLTVMGAYNLIDGIHCCHHPRLLQEILKEEWGFPGLVVCDWGGVHDADQVAAPGLDLEMGGKLESMYLDKPFKAGLEAGVYPMAWLDEKVRRVLWVHMRIGKLGDPAQRAPGARLTPRHRAIAKAIADEALVLLKNEGDVLPLDPRSLRRVAVIGDNADRVHAGGGGSSGIRAEYEITPLQGLREVLGDGVEIIHVPGYPVALDGVESIPVECLGVADQAGIRGWLCRTYANRGAQDPARDSAVVPEIAVGDGYCPSGLAVSNWMQRYTATITAPQTGTYTVVARGGDFFEVLWDGASVISVWDLTAASTETLRLELVAGQEYQVELRYRPKVNAQGFSFGWILPGAQQQEDHNPYAEAEAAARAADAVIFCGGCNHRQDTEGVDRFDMQLPGGQDELIARLASVNPRMAVVLFGGSAVSMPWLDQVPALVQAWYPGQEGGRAIGQLLTGAVNPSGRLPFSWPKQLADVGAHALGEYGPGPIRYSEGLNIGYRWHDGDGPAPLFPFGFGLSYTSFAVDGMQVDASDPSALRVRARMTNTGARAGGTVLQCYVSFPDSPLPRPPKALAAFTKVFLGAGASQAVELIIPTRARSHYDPDAKAWQAPAGTYHLHLAWNAAQVVASQALKLPEGSVE